MEDLFGMDLSWMEWTPLTTKLFIAVIAILAAMTVWDLISPSARRKGFLPIGFTRGERLFLSVVILLGSCLVWLAFWPEANWHNAFPAAGVLSAIVVRWG